MGQDGEDDIGSETQKSLAVVIISGLVYATLLTLFVLKSKIESCVALVFSAKPCA